MPYAWCKKDFGKLKIEMFEMMNVLKKETEKAKKASLTRLTLR